MKVISRATIRLEISIASEHKSQIIYGIRNHTDIYRYETMCGTSGVRHLLYYLRVRSIALIKD